MIEEVQHASSRSVASKKGRSNGSVLTVEHLDSINSIEKGRIITSIQELDRVLGGGVVPGSVVLIGGDPGMGKSTLALQIAAAVGDRFGPSLYVTGEESLQQLKQRAERLALSVKNIHGAAETNIETIAQAIIAVRPSIVVIDSIQTMATGLMESSAGSVAQVRECTALLTKIAKAESIPILLIGHVTKDGFIAGPKILEHMVDAVLQFEGEERYAYRVLRALKNRYGSTNEIAVFSMMERGLQGVSNPSQVLLSGRNSDAPGTAVVAVIEGTRPLLVEIQALVSHSGFSMPQRVSTGYDGKRLQMIIAVLEKRCGITLRQHDVFVNVAGGFSFQDPAMDLGVAIAIVSSVYDTQIPSDVSFMGEVGLTGEIRQVTQIDKRIAESRRMGLVKTYIPKLDVPGQPDGLVEFGKLQHVIHDLFVVTANG